MVPLQLMNIPTLLGSLHYPLLSQGFVLKATQGHPTSDTNVMTRGRTSLDHGYRISKRLSSTHYQVYPIALYSPPEPVGLSIMVPLQLMNIPTLPGSLQYFGEDTKKYHRVFTAAAAVSGGSVTPDKCDQRRNGSQRG